MNFSDAKLKFSCHEINFLNSRRGVMSKSRVFPKFFYFRVLANRQSTCVRLIFAMSSLQWSKMPDRSFFQQLLEIVSGCQFGAAINKRSVAAASAVATCFMNLWFWVGFFTGEKAVCCCCPRRWAVTAAAALQRNSSAAAAAAAAAAEAGRVQCPGRTLNDLSDDADGDTPTAKQLKTPNIVEDRKNFLNQGYQATKDLNSKSFGKKMLFNNLDLARKVFLKYTFKIKF